MKRLIIILAAVILGQTVTAQEMVLTRTVREGTRGSRYFFRHFVPGFVTCSNDSLIRHPGYLFNYDKMNGNLLLKTGAGPLLLVNKAKVRSFTLYDDQHAFVFDRVPAIDTGRYVQVLALGAKYKIYKLISTKFVRADYRNDGLETTGNNYDEYADEGTYYVYVLTLKTNNLQKIKLKISSLKTAFLNDEDKLSKFILLHPSDTVGDIYLGSLGDFMNN